MKLSSDRNPATEPQTEVGPRAQARNDALTSRRRTAAAVRKSLIPGADTNLVTDRQLNDDCCFGGRHLLWRGRWYKNLRYLLLKAQRLAALKTEFLVLRKAA